MAAAQSARAQGLRDAGYRLTQPGLAALEAPERSRGHLLEFYGHCPDCADGTEG